MGCVPMIYYCEGDDYDDYDYDYDYDDDGVQKYCGCSSTSVEGTQMPSNKPHIL